MRQIEKNSKKYRTNNTNISIITLIVNIWNVLFKNLSDCIVKKKLHADDKRYTLSGGIILRIKVQKVYHANTQL